MAMTPPWLIDAYAIKRLKLRVAMMLTVETAIEARPMTSSSFDTSSWLPARYTCSTRIKHTIAQLNCTAASSAVTEGGASSYVSGNQLYIGASPSLVP